MCNMNSGPTHPEVYERWAQGEVRARALKSLRVFDPEDKITFVIYEPDPRSKVGGGRKRPDIVVSDTEDNVVFVFSSLDRYAWGTATRHSDGSVFHFGVEGR